ncbi:uncharacterized protein P174DRAFT_442085, partial [Aspergillus novofumigatus IBT 16806]
AYVCPPSSLPFHQDQDQYTINKCEYSITTLSETEVRESVLWDRRVDGGFPEVKVLKSRVRNVVDPQRDLGHTDRALRKENGDSHKQSQGKETEKCEDCQT